MVITGVYSDIAVTFTDIYGNASTVTIDTFTIENVVPEISDVHVMFSSTAFFPQSLQFILKGSSDFITLITIRIGTSVVLCLI